MSKILGIDEVGRGAWAGPMAVGAVVLPERETEADSEYNQFVAELDDSKKLTAKKRRELALEIKKYALGIGIGWVSAASIDKIGLSAALKLAARRAVDQITCDYDETIIDGTIRLVDGENVSTMPKADGLIAAVSAASIVAKVARDEYMARLEAVWPEYGFAGHVGYGTAAHRRAIEEFGVLPVHRRSFAPILKIFGATSAKSSSSSGCSGPDINSSPENFSARGKHCSGVPLLDATRTALSGSLDFASSGDSVTRSSVQVGGEAEDVAAEYLVDRGHEILMRNWRTRFCEVDIISAKDEILYFTEVKYRADGRAGGGIAAVDRKKERQMRFAAEYWLQKHDLTDKIDVRLSVVSLTGRPPKIGEYVKNIGFN
ncbi:MAG: ribonuclease HII [Candidatus Nomurabacteria bacterium]|jgi:ribonuclease HII|nr:ribonuclease HII [Candidatus Nomurabacteria bacterium]